MLWEQKNPGQKEYQKQSTESKTTPDGISLQKRAFFSPQEELRSRQQK